MIAFEIISEVAQIIILFACIAIIYFKKFQSILSFVILLILFVVFKFLSIYFRNRFNFKINSNIEKLKGSYINISKKLLREQRHDFMNTFQIAYGYLQLNNSNKALEYIKKSTDISQSIGKCYFLTVFSISVLLDKKIRVATNKGIEINVEVENYVDSQLREAHNENVLLDHIAKTMDAFINCVNKNIEEPKLFIDIFEYDDRIEFIFDGDLDIELLESMDYYLKNIVKADEGFEVIFYYDSIKELSIEENLYSNMLTI